MLTQSQHSQTNGQKTLYLELKSRILSVLGDDTKRTFTPLELFQTCKIADHNLGYAILSRLHTAGKIDRPARGLYRAKPKEPNGEDVPTLFHGIHLTLDPTLSGGQSPQLLARIQTHPNAKPTKYDKVGICIDLGRKREAYILASASLEVLVECTDNPISPEMLGGILLALDGLFELGFSTLPWMVSRIELNRDFAGVRMDGANAITFSMVDSLLLKAYNKEDALRYEGIIHNIPLMEVLALLEGHPAVGSERVARALEALSRQYARVERVAEDLTLEVYHLKKAIPPVQTESQQSQREPTS